MVELKLIEKTQPIPLSMLHSLQRLLQAIESKDINGLAIIYSERGGGNTYSIGYHHDHETAMGLVREMRYLENRLYE